MQPPCWVPLQACGAIVRAPGPVGAACPSAVGGVGMSEAAESGSEYQSSAQSSWARTPSLLSGGSWRLPDGVLE